MAYRIDGVTVTSVECQKHVRSWHLLRSLAQTLIPCCNVVAFDHQESHHHHGDNDYDDHSQRIKQPYFDYRSPHSSSHGGPAITGTILGHRRGKVSFCIHTGNALSLLLELAVSTQTLAREMRGGFLRIVLESSGGDGSCLLSTRVWAMRCNGRRVGYAVKRRPTEPEVAALRLMGSVVAGAGVIGGKELLGNTGGRDRDTELLYLRAKFRRVRGSPDSESFHLIDPDGQCCGSQEFSVLFFRSR